MSDAILILVGANLAAAAAIVIVMALRRPVRRLFGARVAYGLWTLAPLAALAMLAPARVITVAVPVAAHAPATQMFLSTPLPAPAGPDPWALAAIAWAVGGLASVAWLAWRQIQFGRALGDGRAGPAVVGVLRPRVVVPDDFAQRYTEREQQVVLAHEETHIVRHDSRINALVAALRCANWFNPLVHVAAHYLRIDQELACDAQVVAAHPRARRSYAQAMLKTQLAVRPLPLGCHWQAEAAHPLAERIRLLSRCAPSPSQQGLGTAAVALMGITVACAAWAARPAHIVQVPTVAQMLEAARTPSKAPEAAAASQPARPVLRKVEAALVSAATVAPAEIEPADAAPVPMPAVRLAPMRPDRPDRPDPPGEARRITGTAQQSSVEPGSAVRVVATTVGSDGVPFWIDLTSYGSQAVYRTGAYGWGREHDLTTFSQHGRGHGLFTGVRQRGDQLWVTASLNRRFEPDASGTIVLKSGETGQITLPNGQVVTVTPTVRPETPEEIAEGERAIQDMAVREARGNGWTLDWNRRRDDRDR